MEDSDPEYAKNIPAIYISAINLRNKYLNAAAEAGSRIRKNMLDPKCDPERTSYEEKNIIMAYGSST